MSAILCAILRSNAPVSKPQMQLLVFAHTPPPLHGQSVMVQTLVEGLPTFAPSLKIFHVNPRLSRDSHDIGRWRGAKLLRLLRSIGQALYLRMSGGEMSFYYVPAPGKRSALYRDWLVMAFCRPFFTNLILHWHAAGLGEWLENEGSHFERWTTQLLLARPALSIVLAPELAADSAYFASRRMSVVANGIDVQVSGSRRTTNSVPHVTRVLFLGLCSREKGLFDALEGVALANRREPAAFQLCVAGGFATQAEQQAFVAAVATQPAGTVEYVGQVGPAAKGEIFTNADVFCFPTSYPHEGQPLTLIEALAHGVPIISTRWRAIPGMLPAQYVSYVEPGRPDQIAEALWSYRDAAPPPAELRAFYLAHYTRERFLVDLTSALLTAATPKGTVG